MSYGETKVYFDGSHYIAIPHTVRPTKRRPKPIEEEITVVEDVEGFDTEIAIKPSISLDNNTAETNQETNESFEEKIQEEPKNTENLSKNTKKMTKKEYFDELYKKYIDIPRKKRQSLIVKDMLPYFDKREHCENFVQMQMDRKQRNLICRRVRMIRKANLVNFNYFCTFTYDSKLHTEQTFRKKLTMTLANLASKKNWKYMGVWERAPETKRLHFHALVEIPKGTMPGGLIEKSDFSFSAHKRTLTMQNTYFNERFGRSDFQSIATHIDLMKEISYICKYLEKTEEKIVYSKGLYQYFISDIMDDDIVCTIGQEDKKLLLFDDFTCWDEGCLVGKVSPEVIAQMRKCNN